MRFLELLRAFGRDTGGQFAILFAVCGTTLLLGAGVAVDYGRAINAQSAAQYALDSATLGTLQRIRSGSLKASNQKALEKSVADIFISNGAGGDFISGYDIESVKVSMSTGSTLVADARVTVPTTFMQLAGTKKLDVALTSTVSFSMSSVDIDIMFDRSLTMSLPSDPKTPTPITKVTYGSKTVNCAFACHDDGSTARAKGIPIKIDVVAAQIKKFADGLSTSGWKGKMMLHSFYGPATVEVAPTSNPKDVSNFFNTPVQLKGSDTWGESTDLDMALKSAYDDASKLPGKDKALVFITDGQHMRSQNAYSGAYCTSLKTLGYKIYVIHVTFDAANLEVPGLQDPDGTTIPKGDITRRNKSAGKTYDYSNWYMGYFSGTDNNVANMKKCSSGDGYYFSGTSGPEIEAAFTAFAATLYGTQLRLTD